MPVLGNGGSLVLQREAPEPLVLPALAINSLVNAILVRDPGFWTGDAVRLTCFNGLPFDNRADTAPGAELGPDAPDGYAIYHGSQWHLGYNKSHITDEGDPYYKPLLQDGESFYTESSQTGLTQSATFYIYRDQLDRISFYPTRAQAFTGNPSERVSLSLVNISGLILSAAGNSTYNGILDQCAYQIRDLDLNATQEERPLRVVCPSSAALDPKDTLSQTQWVIQAYLNDWTLNLSAPEVDTTALGERFGDSVKSLVTGGGTLDFLVEHAALPDGHQDPIVLLHLLLLTQKGCKAKARFYMFKDRQERSYILPGSLYYETDLMITSEAINTRSGEIIAGSLDFVTVGSIALRVGTN